ncbi:polyphenol oxidase family protein [Propionibacteriaceae bacterium Y1700]|uniref:polyphenol oxidase family protein n=1 Tax=Microlunatus sp. Y1700 TaxID=3418487 RepID=UPI003DA70927
MFAFQAQQGSVGVAFTDRYGGVSRGPRGELNLGRTDLDDVDAVRENFGRVRSALGLGTVAALGQQHTTAVEVVDAAWLDGWTDDSPLGSSAGLPRLPVADAMVTALTEVALCIRVADCLPVLFADEAAGVVGAAHAGRVGLSDGVLPYTVAAMTTLGATAITAWIGPHICGRCYEVPAAMRDEVEALVPGSATETSWGTPALDLAAGAQRQLEDLGCRVLEVGNCTLTDTSLHSHRRDGLESGRLAGLVWRTVG